MIRQILAALGLASLAACVTVPPNPIAPAQRAAVFVEGVSANWSVEDGRRVENPAYLAGKDEFTRLLTEAVKQQFANSPSGAEAVEFVVDVKQYNRVGMAMTTLIGGSNMAVADVTVRRKSDGQALGVYTGVTGMHTPPAGVLGLAVQAMTRPDAEAIMAQNFAQNLKARWERNK